VQIASGGCDKLVGDGADSCPAYTRGRPTGQAGVAAGGRDRPLLHLADAAGRLVATRTPLASH
jgi:hypothetical protein